MATQPQGFQPTGQPGFQPPPGQQGGVEYLPDDLPAPQANIAAGAVYPGQDYDAGAPGPTTEELIEMYDPYAPPKFQIRRGKKPVMEINALAPKITIFAVGVIVLALVIYFGYQASVNIRYTLGESDADQLFAQNRNDEAILAYEKCKKINPTEEKPYGRLGEIYFTKAEQADSAGEIGRRTSMLNQSAANLETAIKIDPSDAGALYELARVYKMKGDTKTAIDMARRTLRADPKYGSAKILIQDLGGKVR